MFKQFGNFGMVTLHPAVNTSRTESGIYTFNKDASMLIRDASNVSRSIFVSLSGHM